MEILNLLKKLNEEKKTTIIIAIHDINLASRYSDEIIILNMGKVIDNGVPEKVITKENMEKVYSESGNREKQAYKQPFNYSYKQLNMKMFKKASLN